MANAPKIEVNKTRNHDYRATFEGYASGPSRIAATPKAARAKFQNEVSWRSGKPYDPQVNGMSGTLLTMTKKARRHAIKRPWNFAGRIVLGAIAASLICFIVFHDSIVSSAPVKQDNRAIVRGR